MKLTLQNKLIDTDLLYDISSVAPAHGGYGLPSASQYIFSDKSIVESDTSVRKFLDGNIRKSYFSRCYFFTVTLLSENKNTTYNFFFKNYLFDDTLVKKVFSPNDLFSSDNLGLQIFRKGWIIVKEEDLKELEKADTELKAYVQSVRDKLAEYWENNPSKYPKLEDLL